MKPKNIAGTGLMITLLTVPSVAAGQEPEIVAGASGKAEVVFADGCTVTYDAEGRRMGLTACSNDQLIAAQDVYAARLRGVAGIVLQGLVRDSGVLAAQGLPVFASGATARGPVKETLGPVQVPIQCGGVLVRPGDLVAGDDDGVVVIPREQAGAVAERIRVIHEREEQVKKALAAGHTTVDILGLRAKLPQ